MNKKYLVFGLIGLFAMALVTAGYAASSFMITTDVYEPFKTTYSAINYEGEDCSNATRAGGASGSYDLSSINPGEQFIVCARTANKANADINYTFSGTSNCEDAFTIETVKGVVPRFEWVQSQITVKVNQDATPARGCELEMTVTRG